MISFRSRFRFQILILALSQVAGGAMLAGQPATTESPARPVNGSNSPPPVRKERPGERKPVLSPEIPLPPQPKSPVQFFKELLAMTPAQQLVALSNRPPENRKLILAKVREYRSLSENERRLRLQATELEWYLVPLLKAPATNRAVLLVVVPEEYRKMIQTRLEQWDQLPESVRTNLVARRESIRLYLQMTSGHALPTNSVVPLRPKVEDDLAKIRLMSEADRQNLITLFNQYFDLTPREKQRALQTLSPEDQKQIEKSLSKYKGLTPDQRERCIRSFGEFANMSPAEQQQFLKNAEHWITMTPDQRRAWREVVERVAITPPMSSEGSKRSDAVPTSNHKSHVATNGN